MLNEVKDRHRNRIYRLSEDDGMMDVLTMADESLIERVPLISGDFVATMNVYIIRGEDAPNQPDASGFTPRFDPEIG